MSKRTCYVLYDERARLGPTDEASVLCTAQSLSEARGDRDSMFPEAVIYKAIIDPDNVCRKEVFIE